MKNLFIAVIVAAGLTGCASDPARRAQVAMAESARLPAPTSPLSSYRKFELRAMEMGPEVASDTAKAAVAGELDAKVQARVQPLLAKWNAEAGGAAADKTLIVQPRAMNIRMISAGARFWAGAFAGDSSISMDLELKDAATSAVIANPRISRSASAMSGAWSIGSTDRNLMDYIADIAGQYLHEQRK